MRLKPRLKQKVRQILRLRLVLRLELGLGLGLRLTLSPGLGVPVLEPELKFGLSGLEAGVRNMVKIKTGYNASIRPYGQA